MPITRQQSIHHHNSYRMSCGRKSAHGGLEPTESKDRCVWTEGDEIKLIEYITVNRSKGGDGMNFDHTSGLLLLLKWKTTSARVQARQRLHVNQNGGGYVLYHPWSDLH